MGIQIAPNESISMTAITYYELEEQDLARMSSERYGLCVNVVQSTIPGAFIHFTYQE